MDKHTPTRSDLFNVEINEDGSIISLLSTWRGYGKREMIPPIAVGDQYMLFGHKPPFKFTHARCEWTKESAIAKAEEK
jgi:hypothetical protein